MTVLLLFSLTTHTGRKKNEKNEKKTKKNPRKQKKISLSSNERAPGRVDVGPLETQGVLQGLRARGHVVVLDDPAEFDLEKVSEKREKR